MMRPFSRHSTSTVVRMVIFWTFFCVGLHAAPAPPDKCADLKSVFSRPNTIITSSETVAAGTLNLQNRQVGGLETRTPPVTGLPTFCRVIGILTPTSDSKIGIEVWMPTSTWNGKLQAIGNHALGGIYYYGDMGTELKKGFAVAATDTGHTGRDDTSWALGHPEKIVDYAWRAVHEMTVAAKTIIATFYGSNPRFSYFNGCSTGGRQALKAAQKFPDDYDGILSGGGFHYWTHIGLAELWKIQVMLKDGVDSPSYLPPDKYPLIMNAAMAHCSSLKAVQTDNFLNNAGRCDWNPKTLVCKAGQDPNTCITAAQADALEKIYAPLRNPRTKAQIYPGATTVSEPDWAEEAARLASSSNGLTADAPRSLESILFNRPDWNWRTVNFDSDVALADETDANGPQINAIDPDLSKFQQHGGKLIEYQGWLDSTAAPYSIENYENVIGVMGKQIGKSGEALKATQDFYRLFLVPGLGHCRGGPGPNAFGAPTHPAVPSDSQHDIVNALVEWVEHGKAPKQVIATKYVKDDPKQGIVMQRPVCPYPEEARYKGSGSTSDAKSFECVKPASNLK
jgi:feruloyl esterase